jgi:type VI secretion system protein VasD
MATGRPFPRRPRGRESGRLAVLFIAGFIAAACGKAPPPQPPLPPTVTVVTPPVVKAKATVTIDAASDVNPNDAGRPSPVVVRVYQLKNDAAFRDADFGKLYGDDQAALGQDLLRRDEYTLSPSEHRAVEVELPNDGLVLCAMAAFQNINTSVWRACAKLPASVVSVAIERARIVVTTEGL